jgi:hypothetical protein
MFGASSMMSLDAMTRAAQPNAQPHYVCYTSTIMPVPPISAGPVTCLVHIAPEIVINALAVLVGTATLSTVIAICKIVTPAAGIEIVMNGAVGNVSAPVGSPDKFIAVVAGVRAGEEFENAVLKDKAVC